jgi:hypothetical protein
MITQRAMLTAVHISIWMATKHDRKVSRDVANQHGAQERAGRYNKQLLMGASKLEELRTLAGQIRQHFYKITLPWSDEGLRLLPSHFYFDLTAGCGSSKLSSPPVWTSSLISIRATSGRLGLNSEAYSGKRTIPPSTSCGRSSASSWRFSPSRQAMTSA